MMTSYSVRDAQERLQELIDDAQQGKTVVIHDKSGRIVRLVPMTPTQKPRKAGSARGLLEINEDFDAPLEDFSEYME
jgi:antitoxin (DNA-binding transcriptional repressor) of toxin-antitoxin stability system